MTRLKKILHIDDDAVMRMMIRKSLERSQKDFDIVSCASSNEFIENISSFLPDLLIIDVVMPEIKGPDLLKRIREKSCYIPAIFMTGQDDLKIDDRENLEPIIGIIQKPFSPTTLGDDLIGMWNGFKS